MDPVVDVLIRRIEELAIEKAGLSTKIDGLWQDVQSAERIADQRGSTIQELRCTNAILVSGMVAIERAVSGPNEALVAAIKEALRAVSLHSQQEAR